MKEKRFQILSLALNVALLIALLVTRAELVNTRTILKSNLDGIAWRLFDMDDRITNLSAKQREQTEDLSDFSFEPTGLDPESHTLQADMSITLRRWTADTEVALLITQNGQTAELPMTGTDGVFATPVGLLVLLLAFDWRLGLLSLAPVVLAFLIMTTMTGKQMAEKMRQYGNALEAMSNEAVEYVRGIPVVKTFGQSVFSFKKFKTTIDEYEKWVISYTKDLRLPMMFYTAAVNGVFAFLIAGGLLFTAHGVTTEFLLNLLFYIIITPVISLTLTRMMYMSESKMVVADALARIDSVLEAAPIQVQAVPQHPKDASVALQNVRFSYDGETEVIKGVSLEIQPGRTVAFVGPSGGGKSTLANLVCRFFDVQSGSVRVGGADVRDIPKEELMDTISFVFQNSRLLKGSILDNVRLGRPQATEAEVLAALKAAQCMDIIEKFPAGIHTVIGTKGVYLSGGEQQRIAIARAMLKNVPILILDEATAFADPDNEAKVQAAFAQLAKGKTVLMIAHRLSTVANADCIYVVQDGQIVESGTKDELCAQNGLFARMWQEYQASVQWKVAKEG